MFGLFAPVYFSGIWRDAAGPVLDVIAPATLAVAGRIAEATLGAARAAQRLRGKRDAKSRATALHKLANRIEATDMRRCAVLMCREMGKACPDEWFHESEGRQHNGCPGALRRS
ncbi:MAG TPA: hypothetical protein VMH92_01940 [Acidocella sp.]|nr:hypothetical protein [Acidocella sp.]